MLSPIRLAPLPSRDGNAASLAALPTSALPDGPARAALLTLANAGADCYAYTPASATSGPVIWLGPADSAWDGRMRAHEWTACYALVTGYPTDDGATLALANQYSALWASGYTAGPGSEWRRSAGLTAIERGLTYLRWRAYIADGLGGASRFRQLLLLTTWPPAAAGEATTAPAEATADGGAPTSDERNG